MEFILELALAWYLLRPLGQAFTANNEREDRRSRSWNYLTCSFEQEEEPETEDCPDGQCYL